MSKDDNPLALSGAENVSVSQPTGIAAIALSLALKYHDINTVQDGALYQQYKLEGRNLNDLHLDMVFDTALQMENYLLGAEERFAKIVIDAAQGVIADAFEKFEAEEENPKKAEQLPDEDHPQ